MLGEADVEDEDARVAVDAEEDKEESAEEAAEAAELAALPRTDVAELFRRGKSESIIRHKNKLRIF